MKPLAPPPLKPGDALLFTKEPETDAGPDPEFEPMRAALWEEALDPAWEAHPARSFATPMHRKVARYANLAHVLLKEAPMTPALAEILPERAVADAIKTRPEDHPHAGAVVHMLQFFCQTEIWMRGMELAAFDA